MVGLREREFHPLKVLHHIDRLRALAVGEDVAPVTVEIDPVAYCNHACGWCVDPVHQPVRLADEVYAMLLTELAGFSVSGFRVEGIVFKGGGEPTLHPCFGNMVEQAVEQSFAVGVVTNGSRLHRWAGVLGQRAAYVRVSIDGPTAESHERIHHGKDFAVILQGIRALIAARDGRRHPVVGLSFAMDIHSVELAPEAVRLGESLEVDYVLLRPPFFEEVGREPTMTPAEAQEVRTRLRRLVTAYQGPLEVMVGDWIGDAERHAWQKKTLESAGRRDLQVSVGLPIEHRTGRCLASPLLAVVTADGTVYGCCNLRSLSPWALGRLDYSAGIGFAAVWQSEQRRDVLVRMHRTECLDHCTHPLLKYNEIIEVLRDPERPHSQFV